MISTSWQRTKSQSVLQRAWIFLSHQSLPKRCTIHQILRRHVHLPHPLNDCSRVTDTDWHIGTSTSTLHRILPPRSEMSSSISRTNSSTMASAWTLKISWSTCSRFRNGNGSSLMIVLCFRFFSGSGSRVCEWHFVSGTNRVALCQDTWSVTLPQVLYHFNLFGTTLWLWHVWWIQHFGTHLWLPWHQRNFGRLHDWFGEFVGDSSQYLSSWRS